MSTYWPAIRTVASAHRGYEIGHAASIGLAVILIGLPLLGLGLSWLSEGSMPESELGTLTLYSVSQMLAYSPLLSWAGLLIGLPFLHAAIRFGYGGWLIALAIGAVAGAIVLVVSVTIMIDFTSVRVAGIGAVFGAVFSGIYWMTMRLTSPGLFLHQSHPA